MKNETETVAVETVAVDSLFPLAEFTVADYSPADRMPTLRNGRTQEIVTKSGKVTGTRFFFDQSTLAEFKAALSANKIRGEARRKALQQFFHADAVKQRQLLGRLFMEEAFDRGMVPDTADLRDKSAVLKMVSSRVPEAKGKSKATATVAELQAEIARLKAELAAK